MKRHVEFSNFYAFAIAITRQTKETHLITHRRKLHKTSTVVNSAALTANKMKDWSARLF